MPFCQKEESLRLISSVDSISSGEREVPILGEENQKKIHEILDSALLLGL